MVPLNPLLADVDLVIWDFDGTILDTEWPAFESATLEYERYGRSIELEKWQETLGSAAVNPWWAELRDDVGGFDETEEAFLLRYRAYKNELTDANELNPGVRELLSACADRGQHFAMASSSPRYWLDRHIPRLSLAPYFPVIVSRDDVGAERTKPHPDLFELAASRSGVAPNRCLVIEDTRHGVEAAKTAGMATIAVPHRLTAMQDFSQADRVVSSLQQLLDEI